MKIKLRRATMFTALAFELKQYLPKGLVERLCKERGFWRDLPKRLAVIPIIPKARLIGTEKGDPIDTAIKFAADNGLDLYYGYFITASREKTSIEPHAFCVYDGKVVEPSANISWGQVCYYVGIPVPIADIEARRFENRFERMEYVMKNLR
jgi:hypothetical protein